MGKKKEDFNCPAIIYIEAVVMPNREVVHYGRSLGFICEKQMELIKSGATKLTKGKEVVVALWDNVA